MRLLHACNALQLKNAETGLIVFVLRTSWGIDEDIDMGIDAQDFIKYALFPKSFKVNVHRIFDGDEAKK